MKSEHELLTRINLRLANPQHERTRSILQSTGPRIAMRIEQTIVRGSIDGAQRFAKPTPKRVSVQSKTAAGAARESQHHQIERHFR